MARLITDPFVRGIAQVVVVAALAILTIVCLLIDFTVIAKYRGELNEFKPATLFLFSVLALPFKELAGQIIVVFGSLVPVVLAAVCFKIDHNVTPPAASAEFNAVGRAVVIIMILGLLAGFVALALSHKFSGLVLELSETPDAKQRAVAAIAAIVSFQAIYLAQLMGLKPK